jgi:uncharacterized protein YukE
MADIIANPDELEEFARHLDAFVQETRDRMQRLNAELNDMGASSWRDARYQEYSGWYEQVQGQVSQACDTFENEHVTYLRSLAERLRAYL